MPGVTDASDAADRFTVAAVTGLADENVVVTPSGAPVTVKFTPPVNPPLRVIATTVAAVCPAVIDAVAGVSAMLAAPPAATVTVSATVAVASVTPVPRARTVTPVVVPVAAVPETASARLLAVAPALSVDGVNVAVTPVGRFSAVSATSPVKFVRATVIADVPLALCTTDSVGDPAVTAILADVFGGFVTPFFPLHAVHTSTLAARTRRETLLFICKGRGYQGDRSRRGRRAGPWKKHKRARWASLAGRRKDDSQPHTFLLVW